MLRMENIMCLYPKLIQNSKYKPNKKNKGEPPLWQDERTLSVAIGCGKCEECRRQRANNWRIRLSEEFKTNKTALFVTLSFSDKSLNEISKKINSPIGNDICTYAIRHFLENWRKKYKKSVKHWLITEMGDRFTERIHIHGILWSDKIEEIKNKWIYGNVWIGTECNLKTINYIIKYCTKIDEKHKGFEGKIHCSSGIGKSYFQTWNAKQNQYNTNGETLEYYLNEKGYKMGLPIYYRNKIYSDWDREQLWLQKLDKNERFINGIKYKFETTDEIKTYLKALEYYQNENTKKGYGNWNWKKKNYICSLTFLKPLNDELNSIRQDF